MTASRHSLERLDPAFRHIGVKYQPTASLVPSKSNPRTHSKKQIHQIAESILCFGFTNPVLVDRDNKIIAGHGRLLAAKLLQIEKVPVICLADLNEAEIRAYVIADNKLAENADWDQQLLAIELQYLSDLELDFDITVTGFETPEIDILLDGQNSKEAEPVDQLPEIDVGPAVSRLGDLWHLGRHKLLCGDATKASSYAQLLRGEKAQMVFTDPPYNVPVDGHVCGLGRTKHAEFAMASGEMSDLEFIKFLQSVFGHLVSYSSDGSIHFICMDWRHLFEVTTAARSSYSEFKNLCVWNKSNGGMGSLYRSKHELVFVYKSGMATHINNIELGKHGRYRTNVWDYTGVNTFGSERSESISMHPTVKPVGLVRDAILDCSKRNGIILDSFGGSGTTLIAAEQAGRKARLIEYEPMFVDTIIKRFQLLTGEIAIHSESKKSFNEIRELSEEANDVR